MTDEVDVNDVSHLAKHDVLCTSTKTLWRRYTTLSVTPTATGDHPPAKAKQIFPLFLSFPTIYLFSSPILPLFFLGQLEEGENSKFPIGGGGGGPPAAHIKEARGYGDSCPQFLWFKCLLFDSSFSCKKK